MWRSKVLTVVAMQKQSLLCHVVVLADSGQDCHSGCGPLPVTRGTAACIYFCNLADAQCSIHQCCLAGLAADRRVRAVVTSTQSRASKRRV